MEPVEYCTVDRTSFGELKVTVKTPRSKKTYRLQPEQAEGLARQILEFSEGEEVGDSP